jgi:hypothetical protein
MKRGINTALILYAVFASPPDLPKNPYPFKQEYRLNRF